MSDDALPVALIGRFTVRPLECEAFDALTTRAIAEVRANEPGTLVYAWHRVADDARLRICYELYSDRRSFTRHKQQSYITEYLKARSALVESVETEFLALVDGTVPPGAVT